MKVYITDTNVIFSAVLNLKSGISQFIMSANQQNITFYAPDFLRIELERYIPKLIDISNLSTEKIRRIITLVYAQITFISDELIPFEYYKNALPFVRDVDMDDLVFVALTDYLDETLWTGDLKLYKGLIARGYTKVVIFQEIKEKLDF
jgi:predicted nucleic acid-binding protein